MNKLLLSTILKIDNRDLPKWKLRFNRHGGGKSAFEHYLNNKDTNEFDSMTMYCTKKSMFSKGDKLIGLAKADKDLFLLVKIYEILDENKSMYNTDKRYKYKVLDEYSYLFGRVFIKVRCDHSKTYPVQKLINIEKESEFEIVEIKSTVAEEDGFSGYDHVSLSYEKLKRIIDRKPEDWVNALSNQQAVYVITDLSNGKLYVGSATSKSQMLLSRWSSYIKSGHGGNKEFKKIVNDPAKGFEYIKKNFQYSIIENFNSTVSHDFILKREQYWKSVFDSIKHGMNDI